MGGWNPDDRPRDGGGSVSAEGTTYRSRILERKAGATAEAMSRTCSRVIGAGDLDGDGRGDGRPSTAPASCGVSSAPA
ncbi:hypothetical protein, partial [Streptomyces sp. NPDC002550]